MTFQYIQDQPPQKTSLFEGVAHYLADMVWDAAYNAQVNVCMMCGVVQESVDGTQYLPWSDTDPVCQECEADFEWEMENATSN